MNIKVNGETIQAKQGNILIDVLDEHGIFVPRFCYHKSLGTDGNCRMCMVEIEGKKRPQISCDTPVSEGLSVYTHSDSVKEVRKKILELELINHPVDCPICDKAGECDLQNYYMEADVYESRFKVPKVDKGPNVNLNENIIYNANRCVLCKRCVRFTQKIPQTGELCIESRTDHSRVSVAPGKKLENPYAMNIVDLCPVGALSSSAFRFQQRVWFLKSFNAICNGCSRGCSIKVDHNKEKDKDDVIYRYTPRFQEDVNGFFMCDVGRLEFKKENLENQIQNCSIDGEVVEPDAALQEVANLIKSKKVFILVSPHLSLEELDIINDFAHNIDAKLNGFCEQYIDENFKDEYLKTNDKTPNKKALDNFGIYQDENHLTQDLEQSDVVLIFENNLFNTRDDLIKNKKVILFGSYNDYDLSSYDIVVKIASFMQKNGTYINVDDKKQKVVSTFNPNQEQYDATQIINMLTYDLQEDN